MAQILGEFFGTSAVSYTSFETGVTTVSLYLKQKPELSRLRRRQLIAAIDRLTSAQSSGKAAGFALQKIRNRDWAESWKLHFKPIEIGSRLLIKPGWSRKRARKGQAVVILDPGLSFGTGRHPTTLFCLRQVARPGQGREGRSFLDIGTGSCILAIAAAKLGYAPVAAFDHDPAAIRVARENARRNRVLHKIDLSEQDVTELPARAKERYDLVCANLISNLLIEERDGIVERVRPGGRLVLAGVLDREFSQVANAYAAAGLRLISRQTQREWCSGLFSKKLNGIF